VPPLRTHIDDLPGIASAIIERLCSKDPSRAHAPRPSLTVNDLEWARMQPLKGNIRELEEVIEQWLLDGAKAPLEVVAGRRQYSDAGGIAGHGADVLTMVRHEIEEILANRKPSPGTFSKFVSTFTHEVEEAVTRALLDWYRERRPDQATLKRLFRDMQWNSIKSVLSRAGKRR
jgi:DNA-binding NtrC family response regulator